MLLCGKYSFILLVYGFYFLGITERSRWGGNICFYWVLVTDFLITYLADELEIY